ncbi:MAG: NAD(P)-dependent oxidoreductase [Sphingorhabdus sp.]
MEQLPLFLNMRGKPVILLGNDEAAEAKRRLIERAGGLICSEDCTLASLAFIAIEEEAEAVAAACRLKARGLLVNVVDRPLLCDFTVPAIVDRDPVLVAVGTGGASAGLAKMVRQAIERLLPARLGELALGLQAARDAIRGKWPDGKGRRRALDDALVSGGILDPLDDGAADRIDLWLQNEDEVMQSRVETIHLISADPEELTLKAARLLGQADHIFADGPIGDDLINRARADAVRYRGAPPDTPPEGLVIHLRLRHGPADA